MNILTAILNTRNGRRLAMVAVLVCAAGAMALRSSASTPLLQITITNNTGQAIHHLYLSPANSDQWGSDLLDGTVINSGASHTINASWGQSTVKIVAEDQDGCFLYNTVDAGSSVEWTITSSWARNCG